MSWTELEPHVRAASTEVREAMRRAAEAAFGRPRRVAVNTLARQLGDDVVDLIRSLAESIEPAARQLALELIGQVKRRPAALRRQTRTLLADRTIPLSVRGAAATALLRKASQVSALRLLRAFASGLGRSRPVARLDALAPKLGHPEQVAIVRAELLNRQKMRCPRCGVMRRRRRMVRHLWNHHQLLLEGRRALSPLQALDDRLERLEPEAALVDLHRFILSKTLRDVESAAHLTAEAESRHQTVCPDCAALISLSEPMPTRSAEMSSGRLSVEQHSVTIDETGVWPRLRVDSGGRVIFDGREPGQGMTITAARWLALACMALALFVAAQMPTPWHAVTAGALIMEALVLLYASRRSPRRDRDMADRVINCTWTRLIPELPVGPSVSRIALASVGHGNPKSRAEILFRAIGKAQSKTAAATVLPSLVWLQAHDDQAVGRDVLPALVDHLSESICGHVPMSSAENLLQIAAGLPSRAARERLRIQICERAFDAGLGVWDLAELGRAHPAFASTIRTDNLDGLARLRLIWEQRPNRPWRVCGPAVTVFEMARYPILGGEALASAPDLLLYQLMAPDGPGREAEPLELCGRGLLFRGALIREQPANIVVMPREVWRGGGFDLRVDAHRFRCDSDPSLIAERISRSARYLFEEFLPKVDGVLRYRSTERLATLMSQCVAACPECGKSVIPVAGRFALPVS